MPNPTLVAVQSSSAPNFSSGSMSFSDPGATRIGDLLVHVGLITTEPGVATIDTITPPSGWEVGSNDKFDSDCCAFFCFYREAISDGSNSYSFTGNFTGSDSTKDRRGLTFAIRDHRPLIQGSPFAAFKSVRDDTDDGSLIAYRQVTMGTVDPDVADTLLILAAFARATIGESSSGIGYQAPSGMTLAYHAYGGSGQQISLAAFYQILASAAETDSKTAGVSGHTTGRQYTSDAGFLFAVRPIVTDVAPNVPTAVGRDSSSPDTDTTPLLTATISDANVGQQVKARFQIYQNDGTTLVGSVDSAFRAGDGVVTAEYSSALPVGQYKVQAQAIDDTALSSSYSVQSSFQVTSLVEKDLSLLWKVQQNNTKDLTLLWNVQQNNTKDLSLLWNTKINVQKDLTLLWNILLIWEDVPYETSPPTWEEVPW